MNMTIGALEIEKREQGTGSPGFGRNLMVALTAATLAGIMAFQALGPATLDRNMTLTERSAEVLEASQPFAADSSEALVTSAISGSGGLIK
jgi:hypothetical protein